MSTWSYEEDSGQNTGVGSHSLLQGIFPTQGSNPGLPQSRQIMYQLSPRGSMQRTDKVQYASAWGCAQSCLSLCDPIDCKLPGSSVHGILQARILEWGCHFLLQGICPTQGLNPCLLHCRWIPYPLSHCRKPIIT